MEKETKTSSSAKTSAELIALEMDANGTKKEQDVTQLYLAQRNLQTVVNLGCYKHLNELWLNGNKLRHITCLRDNFRISHLYLQDNELVSISRAISHLSCLKVLMLNNNQLTKLEEVVNEMKNMQALHTLNLHHNPLAQENEYRLYVVFSVPSLKLLDQEEVSASERTEALRRYEPDKQRQLDSVAFGRRCIHPATTGGSAVNEEQLVPEVFTRAFTEKPQQLAVENRTDPVDGGLLAERGVKRSTMQYSHFDWAKVPRVRDRRLNKTGDVADCAQIVTVRFR